MVDLKNIKEILKQREVCVVIPTYNNGGTIKSVVLDALNYCDDIIVVDDGSTDETKDILNKIQDITVITHPNNKGKGTALKHGFKKALSMGFSYAISMDGDGQHYPESIACFLSANQKHPGSLIVGDRNLKGVNRSKGSSFANLFSNFWFYIQTGIILHDTQTGYRLYPLKKLYGLSLLTSRYEAELELLVFAAWHGVKISSIPIDVYYPPIEKRVSHFKPITDFARISLLNTILCVLAVVYGLPLRLFRFVMKSVRTVYSLLSFLFMALIVITPFVWLYTKAGKITERKRQKLHKLIQRCAKFVMIQHGIPGTKFKYQVAKGVVFEQPRVIICNHQSHLDLMCQLIFTPNIVFLTNNWVWNNPLYGLLIRNADYLPVEEGLDALMPRLRDLVEKGYSVAVYPEGTRSKTLEIGRFHQGPFYIAQQLDLEILPMYLYGTGRVLPKNTYSLNKGMIYIEVDYPISQEELKTVGDLRAQASYMRKHYKEKYLQISNLLERDA